MSLAQRVRECRYSKGWGPDELANRADISRTALYQIESGKTELPRAATVRRIAEALGVSVEALFDNETLRTLATESHHPSTNSDRLMPGSLATHSHRRMLSLVEHDEESEVFLKVGDLLNSSLGHGLVLLINELHRMLETSRLAPPANSEHG